MSEAEIRVLAVARRSHFVRMAESLAREAGWKGQPRNELPARIVERAPVA